MPVMSQKTTQYTYGLDELKKLIASDLKVPVEAVTVRYDLRDESDDRFGGSPSYNVHSVTVTVDSKLVEASQKHGQR